MIYTPYTPRTSNAWHEARHGENPNALLEEAYKLERELTEERELRIMQLAAISTATIQNTDSSIKDRIGAENPYCSTAYLDTCVAVDREMKHRKELTALREGVERLATDYEKMKYRVLARELRALLK